MSVRKQISEAVAMRSPALKSGRLLQKQAHRPDRPHRNNFFVTGTATDSLVANCEVNTDIGRLMVVVVVVVGRMSSSCKIAIVGGGLAVAYALKSFGTKAEVFETAPALGEIGAAVNTSPQAVKASLARQPRILEVEEIKSIPYVPVSHSFVQRDRPLRG